MCGSGSGGDGGAGVGVGVGDPNAPDVFGQDTGPSIGPGQAPSAGPGGGGPGQAPSAPSAGPSVGTPEGGFLNIIDQAIKFITPKTPTEVASFVAGPLGPVVQLGKMAADAAAAAGLSVEAPTVNEDAGGETPATRATVGAAARPAAAGFAPLTAAGRVAADMVEVNGKLVPRSSLIAGKPRTSAEKTAERADDKPKPIPQLADVPLDTMAGAELLGRTGLRFLTRGGARGLPLGSANVRRPRLTGG